MERDMKPFTVAIALALLSAFGAYFRCSRVGPQAPERLLCHLGAKFGMPKEPHAAALLHRAGRRLRHIVEQACQLQERCPAMAVSEGLVVYTTGEGGARDIVALDSTTMHWQLMVPLALETYTSNGQGTLIASHYYPDDDGNPISKRRVIARS